MSDRAGKTMAGIARAAANTTSVILDSGVGSMIEKFCVRKNVKLLGFCPEAQISYPKLSSKREDQLTSGHSHLFLFGKVDKKIKYNWGDESRFKLEMAKRIVMGRKATIGKVQLPPCKLVTVVMGDNNQSALRDIEASLNLNVPIVVLEGSELCQSLAQLVKDQTEKVENTDVEWGGSKDQIIARLARSSKVVVCENQSETIAQVVHLLLTISV